MNVHLIRSSEFDSNHFWEVLDLLQKFPGIMRFFTNEEHVLIADEEIRQEKYDSENFHVQKSLSMEMCSDKKVEVVKWETFFGKCNDFRRKNDIVDEEFVVLLTDYSNDKNWFAAADPNARNLFVQTKYWDYFAGSDQRYPVAYHVVTVILKKLMFRDYLDLNLHWHEKPVGCMMDFCRNKNEISLKLRTADICPDCLKLISERKVDHTVVQQVFDVLDGIRTQMVYKERFVINRKAPLMVFEGRNQRIVFPELGDLEIRLTPLEKTVYLFFYRHPEGVELNCVQDHRAEILNIYESLSNADNVKTMEARIDDLISPLSNSISEKISRIKRKFSEALGEEMANDFVIGGENAEKRFIQVTKGIHNALTS